MKRRLDLRLIVTSATLDADKFSGYFFNCKIFTIPGRTFLVETLYTKQPETDYLDAALITEIDHACQSLYERMKGLGKNVPELIILPVNIALPSEMQSRIFDLAPPGKEERLDSLVITPFPQASAKPRAGCAGHTGPGKCHNEMSPITIPEIQRINLGFTTLTMGLWE
ncbi:unnamed protein product [Musa acuminata subsp. malaccensis]|uniref:(wild Malaysian banana) hypothetical protein n=1 Tax=Musa acuminata subsp. malaccensis TaxID=214687 RepID=A0A804JUI0_MUSAM|nr:unnamed protein product [Musa acuminata subsp. malaccensis]